MFPCCLLHAFWPQITALLCSDADVGNKAAMVTKKCAERQQRLLFIYLPRVSGQYQCVSLT